MHLSDLEDIEDDDCEKLDSDCEKLAPDEQDLQRAMVVSGAPQKRDCSSELHLSLANSFHAFPCAIKNVAALPPLPSDFVDPVVSKAPCSTGPAGTVSLSHFEVSDKPRIWSLARTAASGVILSPQHSSELRTGNLGGDCQLQSTRLPGAPTGQSGGIRGPHESSPVINTENSFQEGSILHSKVYGTGSYSHKGLQLHCSPYATLPDTCQYSSVDGMSPYTCNVPHIIRDKMCVLFNTDRNTVIYIIHSHTSHMQHCQLCCWISEKHIFSLCSDTPYLRYSRSACTQA